MNPKACSKIAEDLGLDRHVYLTLCIMAILVDVEAIPGVHRSRMERSLDEFIRALHLRARRAEEARDRAIQEVAPQTSTRTFDQIVGDTEGEE